MADISSFLVCGFCGKTDQDPDVNFIIRSSLSKGCCVCDKCVLKLRILVTNCYNDLFEDNGYTLD